MIALQSFIRKLEGSPKAKLPLLPIKNIMRGFGEIISPDGGV